MVQCLPAHLYCRGSGGEAKFTWYRAGRLNTVYAWFLALPPMPQQCCWCLSISNLILPLILVIYLSSSIFTEQARTFLISPYLFEEFAELKIYILWNLALLLHILKLFLFALNSTSKDMEVLNSPANNHRKFRYSKMHGEEQDDFQDSINRQQNTRWHRILIPTLSIICLSLIGLLISTRHFRHNRECNCSNMNDVGSNLLANDGLSIINKIAIPYHYLESEFDVDDFALSDPSWANMFPGKLLSKNTTSW